MQPYLILPVLAGIVATDTTNGPQMLISEPVVSCSIAGILFGRPETGLLVGMFFQLFWLGYMPLGAVRLTDSKMGALIGASSLFTAAEIFSFRENTVNASLLLALLFGVFAGFIGLHLTTFVRRINGKRSENMMSLLEQGEFLSISKWHITGLGLSFLRGVFMALVLVPAGSLLCGMTSFLPDSFIECLSYSALMIWGTVCASAVSLYWRKENKMPFLLGSIGGFLWVLITISRKG